MAEISILEAKGWLIDMIRRLGGGRGAHVQRGLNSLQRRFGFTQGRLLNLKDKKRATEAFRSQVCSAYLALLERSVRNDLQKYEELIQRGYADARVENDMCEAQQILARIQRKIRTDKAA